MKTKELGTYRGAFEQCTLPYVLNVDELHRTVDELNQRRALCGAPIHVVTKQGRIAYRTGINSDPLDEHRRTETIVTVEEIYGPVEGVGKAHKLTVRPRTKIPNFGLPVSNYFPYNPTNYHTSFFGDELNEIIGLDGVGAIIFDERIIVIGTLGRRLLPVPGVTDYEASNFASAVVSYMKKNIDERGDFLGPLLGY